MDFDLKVDIAKVFYVHKNDYTVDLVGLTGTQYVDVPFLNNYTKGDHGINFMPEKGSYGLILKMEPGSKKYVLGFFDTTDENLTYKNNKEDLNEGDYCFKTDAGNKINIKSDGTIQLFASDQSQMVLYPASGLYKDSYGFDNLLRLFVENLQIHTGAGFIHQSINKKNRTSNIKGEIRDKPLYSDNPKKIKFSIGTQSPEIEQAFIYTKMIDEEGTRSEIFKKVDGWEKQTNYNTDGYKIYEKIINGDGSYSITQYVGDGSGNKKIEVTTDSSGELSIVSNQNINLTTTGTITLNSPNVILGNDTIKGSVLTTRSTLTAPSGTVIVTGASNSVKA